MRSPVRRSAFVLLPLLLNVAACHSSPEPTADAHTAGLVVAVATTEATSAEWPAEFEAGGVLRARTTATIASRMMAPIVAIHVRPGDRVRQGQTLVELEGETLTAQATRATASSAAAAQAATAAAADVEAAEASLTLAQATQRRIAALQAQRAATLQELDEANAALSAATARLKSANARRIEATAGAEAATAASRAATNDATYRLLRAPFDGLVSERLADPGSMATPGAPLLVIESPSTMQLQLNLDASRAAFVSLGRQVSVRIDSDPVDAVARSGRVTEISRIDSAGHSFDVKVDLPASASLRSGMYGRARFAGAPRKAIVIAASSVIRRGQLSFVFVASDGRARLRAVSLGETSALGIEVLDGLAAGERVLLSPSSTLADGTRVSLTGASR